MSVIGQEGGWGRALHGRGPAQRRAAGQRRELTKPRDVWRDVCQGHERAVERALEGEKGSCWGWRAGRW